MGHCNESHLGGSYNGDAKFSSSGVAERFLGFQLYIGSPLELIYLARDGIRLHLLSTLECQQDIIERWCEVSLNAGNRKVWLLATTAAKMVR